jgi:C4-dicarboxylate transporter, DctM subunit
VEALLILAVMLLLLMLGYPMKVPLIAAALTALVVVFIRRSRRPYWSSR